MKGGVMFTPEEIQCILENIDPEEVARQLKQFTQNHKYLDSYRVEWLEEYGEQWVVVFEEKLVAVAPTLEELLVKVDEENISRDSLVVEFLPQSDIPLILLAA